jgi:hypothetical protein
MLGVDMNSLMASRGTSPPAILNDDSISELAKL